MFSFFKKKNENVVKTPVLVIDSLGISERIKHSTEKTLPEIVHHLDRNYYRFRFSIPFSIVTHTRNKVFGTNEYSTFRLNDMFIVFSKNYHEDFALRYLITASIAYHGLLLEGFIPRGGLGYGLLIHRNETLIGGGFIDAYEASEMRNPDTKDICAIQITDEFFKIMPSSSHVYKLLYFYKDSYFVNPLRLVDPDLGEFDKEKILDLLKKAGTNNKKLAATRAFLEDGEDYEAALLPNSKSRRSISCHLTSHPSRPAKAGG